MSGLWIFLLGGLLRAAEATLAALPTLLVGLLVAAILRFYFGREGTRRLFGGTSLRSLPQSWAIGMLLPVCSIGVLPILIEMRRSKLKPGAMSAFALSAPLFNPLSLLYGVTLSRPYVILMFAMASLVVVTVVGAIWDRWGQQPDQPDDGTPNQATSNIGEPADNLIGLRRLAAAFVHTCRQVVGPTVGWTLVGLLGVALLAGIMPWGALQSSMERDDLRAPARMVGVAVPVYATPMLAMSQLGMMFQHANSPGAAFILLVIGAGVNLGTIAWMSFSFGIRSVAIWLVSLLAVVVAIAYAINGPMIPPGVNPAGHTHAFDVYTNPIHHLDKKSASFAFEKLAQKWTLIEKICMTALAFFAIGGLLFRCLGVTDRSLGRRGESPGQPATTNLGFDRIVGPRVVGGTLISGLILLSVVMCYAFYPSRRECFKEIQFVRADALTGVTSGDYEHAKFWIPRWDQWTRRLEVGVFLRSGHVTPYQRMQGFLLRTKLNSLEHELEEDHQDKDALKILVSEIMNTDTRFRLAYRKPFQGDPNVPIPSTQVSIQTDRDVDHEHQHDHGNNQLHDHDHGNFTGTHVHSHNHGHRHSDGPHGGVIISLGDHVDASSNEQPHLEVVQDESGLLLIYCVIADGEVWQSLPQPLGELKIEGQGTAKWKPTSNAFEIRLENDPSRSNPRFYHGHLTGEDGESTDFKIVTQ